MEKSFPIRRILACAAETRESDHAVAVAADLAQRLGAELSILHAMAVPPLLGAEFTRTQVADMTAERAERTRSHIAAHLAQELPGVRPGGRAIGELVRVVPGGPPQVVLEELRDQPADLVVLGDSGKRRQLDLGGVARAVISRSTAPVWLQVRPPTPVRRILAPTDLSEHSVAGLVRTIGLARQLDAQVTALYCHVDAEFAYVSMAGIPTYDPSGTLADMSRDAREHFEETLDALDWKDVRHERQFVNDYPARTILGRQDDYDLIAMGTHGRTGLAATLVGSVAHDVLRRAHTPVLALRDSKRKWLF